MPDQPQGGVGGQVAQLRKLNGLTQAQLAQRAHVSLSLVRKVEQGSAPASPAFVSATPVLSAWAWPSCWVSRYARPTWLSIKCSR